MTRASTPSVSSAPTRPSADTRFRLDGKVAIVTGGNSGLGRAITLEFAGAGAKVAVVGRRSERNDAIARELGDQGAAFTEDVCDPAASTRVVDGVLDRWGQVDILVNNAGVLGGG